MNMKLILNSLNAKAVQREKEERRLEEKKNYKRVANFEYLLKTAKLDYNSPWLIEREKISTDADFLAIASEGERETIFNLWVKAQLAKNIADSDSSSDNDERSRHRHQHKSRSVTFLLNYFFAAPRRYRSLLCTPASLFFLK